MTGSLVLAAECAMGDDPRPASFENADRLNPAIKAPINPPPTASPVNASVIIIPKACPT